MPGHVLPPGVLKNAILDAMVVAVAHTEIEIRDVQTYLAPKRTDSLAATIEAEPVKKQANGVRGRIHTTEPYAVFQETKDYYHHRVGQAHYMRNGLLAKAGDLAAAVRAAVASVTG